jgi:hypothetical protein
LKFASAAVLGDELDRLPGRMRSSFPEIADEVFWKLYAAASPFSLLHVTGFYNISLLSGLLSLHQLEVSEA